MIPFITKYIKDCRAISGKRRLMENFLSLSVLRAVNYILPLVTIPYLVRVLGPEKFGLIAFAQAIVSYFAILTDYGFNLSATRNISICREDKKKVAEIFNAVIFIKLVLMLLSFSILAALVFAISKFRNDRTIYLFAFGAVLGNVLFPAWFFQGMEKMKYITFLNFLAKLVFTVSIFIFIRRKADYIYVPLINSLGFVTAGILSLWIIFKNFRVNLILPTTGSIKHQLEDGWHIFISSIAINLYTTSNTVILGIFTNNTTVGFYSAGDKIVRVLVGLFEPLSQTVYPYISKLASESTENALIFVRKIAKGVGVLGLLISFALFVFAPQVSNTILGKDFENSIVVVRILSFLPFLIGLSNVFAVQGLYGFGHYKIVSKYVTICGVIYLPVVITLTYVFNYIGTAISTLIIELVITLLSIYYFAIKFKAEIKPAHV
jgi:PST family polysaccharide transporter